MQKKEFLNYIHAFRGLAILFIVGLHASVTFLWGDEGLMQRKFMVVVFNNGTILFVFIAGYLFYHLNKDYFNYADYLKKKFLYVIVPYLIVSIPAILDKFIFDKVGDHWWLDQGFFDMPAFFKVLFLLLTGRHMGVFWFIPMISIFYLAAPLVLKFSRTEFFKYFVPVLAILGLYTFRFGYHGNILLSLQYFLPVYLFSIWIYQRKHFIFKHINWFLGASILLYFSISICEYYEWLPFNETIGLRDALYTEYRFNYNKFKMLIFCVGALLAFYKFNHVRFSVLALLGNYSFGIFFIHLYVIQGFKFLERGNIYSISPANAFTFLLYLVAVLLITVALVKLTRFTLRKYSRYVIGS